MKEFKKISDEKENAKFLNFSVKNRMKIKLIFVSLKSETMEWMKRA